MPTLPPLAKTRLPTPCVARGGGIVPWVGIILLCAACPEYGIHPGEQDDPHGGPDPTDSKLPWIEASMLEWCNGVDDDGDGMVDEGFTDIDGDGTADCVDEACTVELSAPRSESCGTCQGEQRPLSPPPVDPWNWTVEWAWHEGPRRPSAGTVMSTPVVGDLDADGLPEVVFVYSGDSSVDWYFLAVLDGATGSARWTQGGFVEVRAVALGDLDGDGFGDIVTYAHADDGRPFLRALDRDGLVLWDLEHYDFRNTGDMANPIRVWLSRYTA